MRRLDQIIPNEIVFDANAQKGAPLPWWAKIGAKIVLSRVPLGYDTRKSLGMFRHGFRDRDFEQHRANIDHVLSLHAEFGGGKAATLMELGPGDSVGTALFAAAAGLSRTWLIDVGDFASRDMAVYRDIAGLLEKRRPGFAAGMDLSGRDRMLVALAASYLTQGIESLSAIPTGSVDIAFSTAVLEHVRRAEFVAMQTEIARILRPGGTAHHTIDLSDHLGGSLNHLRFAARVWEHPFMANSGFYTNRLRYSEIIAAMRAVGFELALTRVARWPELPTRRRALAADYRDLPERDLRVASFDVLLRKPG